MPEGGISEDTNDVVIIWVSPTSMAVVMDPIRYLKSTTSERTKSVLQLSNPALVGNPSHAGVAQPARKTHPQVGFRIGRPVIYNSRKFPAADRRAGAATPFDRSSGD